MSDPVLQFGTYQFALRAIETILLPPNAGSTLRGGFGNSFRRIACFQRNRASEGCDGCLVSHTCPYGYVFETRLPPDSEVLRSQNEIPHPFVLEPPPQPPPVSQPGSALDFRVVLAGRAIGYLPYFVMAFTHLGQFGMGRGRGKFQLEEVRATHPLTGQSVPVYRDGSLLPCDADMTATFGDIKAWCNRASPGRMRVHFLSPTRLISERQLVRKPTFPVLVRSALRRLSSLAYFHCGHRWEADFRGLVAEAEEVEIVESDVRWVSWERYSSRQDARMNLGGLVGSATYEGEIGRFLPLMVAASIAHVGKACTFGNGRIKVEW